MAHTSLIKVIQLQEALNEIGDFNNIDTFDYGITATGGRFFLEDKTEVVVICEPLDLQIEDVEVVTDKSEVSDKKIFLPPVLDPKSRPIYNIGFTVNNFDTQYKKTNTKEYFKIIATVIDIIMAVVGKTNDKEKSHNGEYPIYVIFAANKMMPNMGDPQKIKYYEAILNKRLPSGYRMGETKVKNYTGFYFAKD